MNDDPNIPVGGTPAVEQETVRTVLNDQQLAKIKGWAADDRLWTTQQTVEINLTKAVQTILSLVGKEPSDRNALNLQTAWLMEIKNAACEWAAGYPLQGPRSVADNEAARLVYQLCVNYDGRKCLSSHVPESDSGSFRQWWETVWNADPYSHVDTNTAELIWNAGNSSSPSSPLPEREA